jgi:hypothetical protein
MAAWPVAAGAAIDQPMLPDRVFFPLVVLTAALLIALAMVWPQGMGAPSPKPFGHAPEPAASAMPAARAPVRSAP